jgi:hypothetical protein
MHKTLVGLALAALIANPATAQDYRRNFVECAKELGLNLDPNYIQKLQDGRTVRQWYIAMLKSPPSTTVSPGRRASQRNHPPRAHREFQGHTAGGPDSALPGKPSMRRRAGSHSLLSTRSW